MTSGLVAGLLLAQAGPPADAPGDQVIDFMPWEFSAPGGTGTHFMVSIPQNPQSTPKRSPKGNWEFDWQVPAYGLLPGDTRLGLRFRVFAQVRKLDRDLAPLVARSLLQLWGYNARELRLDHNPNYFMQLVDVYLCQEGKPGGEQMLGVDPQNVDQGRPTKTNQIYIYQIESFDKPIEMIREVAHEYGHATLAPIGGYTSPEYWANGLLGERLYLRWMLADLSKDRLKIIDTLGATKEELQNYVANNVTTHESTFALKGPNLTLAKDKTLKGMDYFTGIAAYAEAFLPRTVFRRSFFLAPGDGAGYAEAVVDAAAEQSELTITIPPAYIGKSVWVPTGKGKLNGLKPLATREGWSLVKPVKNIVRVLNPEP